MPNDNLNHPRQDGDVEDVYNGKDHFGKDWSGVSRTRFWRGRRWSRRVFFQHLGAAVGGYFLLPARPMETIARAAQTSTGIGTAKNVIFILLQGAPSHVDTFDLKTGPWTPAYFNPTAYDGVLWPQGLMPKLADQMDSIALVRSVRAWATAHGVAQSWAQLARNPANALARLAPHIGSVVSLELGAKDRTLPAFVSLNTGSGPGEGYLKPENAPMYISPGGAGLPAAKHPDGQDTFNRRSALALQLDAEIRNGLSYGDVVDEVVQFNTSARQLMYNPAVDSIFTFDAATRNLYGNTGFGNACITARNLLKSGLGTRFVQITLGSWDHHTNIYQNNANLQLMARTFDNGLGQLMADLRQNGLLDETLIVAMGEFGRTVDALNQNNGRDHHPQQSVLMAGARIRGKKAIGQTDPDGNFVIEPGWSADRVVRTEDIGASIYSALGIDWTTIKLDYPLGRGFEYIPGASTGLYQPINELWA